MQTVTDEKRHNDQVFRHRELIAIGDARRFFQKNRADAGVNVHRPEQFDLSFDDFAGVFVFFRAMPGNEQRDVPRLWRARERKGFDDFFGTRQQHLGHAVMRTDGRAVVDG